MNDEAGMKRAIEEAWRAYENGEVPVGAAIFHEGQLIAAAGNEREKQTDPTAHAELLAIRRAASVLGRRRLTGCTLYVTLEPCPMCAGAAMLAGLDRILFGAPDPKGGCCGSVYAIPEDPAFPHFCLCDGPFMEKECKSVLDRFFTEKRKAKKQNEP